MFKFKYEEYKNSFKNNPNRTTINYMISSLKELGNTIKI